MSLLDGMNAACEDITADHCRGCVAFKEMFPGVWQWKTSDVMLMKIFGLNKNKSDGMPTKNIFFMDVILCICGNICGNMKCTVIGQARFHFTCNTFVQK